MQLFALSRSIYPRDKPKTIMPPLLNSFQLVSTSPSNLQGCPNTPLKLTPSNCVTVTVPLTAIVTVVALATGLLTKVSATSYLEKHV